MTTHDRVLVALENYNFDENENGINELIAYAYYLGRCQVAKEICDDVQKVFKDQIERASNCRYKHMAMRVQGNCHMIYHGDYDQWVRMFSNDEVKEV